MQQTPVVFNDRHHAAEAAHSERKLKTHIAAAEDDQVIWNNVHLEKATWVSGSDSRRPGMSAMAARDLSQSKCACLAGVL